MTEIYIAWRADAETGKPAVPYGIGWGWRKEDALEKLGKAYFSERQGFVHRVCQKVSLPDIPKDGGEV